MKIITKQIVFYIVFTLLVTGFFLQARFPDKAVESYILDTLAERYPGAFLSLASISLSFPPGLKAENLVFGFRENLESNIRFESLKIRPRLTGYFLGRSSFAVNAAAYGGTLGGRIDYPGFLPAKSPTSANMIYENLALEKCTYLQDRLGRQLSGKLSGSFAYSGTSRLDFVVRNGSYPLLENLLGMNKVDFSQAEGQVTLSGGVLKITKFQLKGDKISCSLKGDITLNPDFKNSAVNLSGTMEVAGLGNKKMSLTITGTVGNATTKYL